MRKILGIVCMLAIVCLSMAALGEGEVLDLRAGRFASLEELYAQLDGTETARVDLTGVPLTAAQRKALIARYPDVHFVWEMELWGVTVSSEDEEVSFEGREWAPAAELCELLDCMPRLKRVNMWDKRVKQTELDTLFGGYPDVFFGLTIKVNERHTIRTDWTAYSTLSKQPLLLKQMHYFSFLKGLKALDVGHMGLHSLSFLPELPKLKILIVVDCGLKDISPLASQPDLEYLEIFKNYVTDISVLAGLTSLRDLNIAYNKITDLSPLYDLPHLERLWVMGNWDLSDEEVARFREHQPNCEVVTYSYGATGNRMLPGMRQIPGTSWRHHKHYDTIHWIFHHQQYIDWDVPVPQIKSINDP